MPDRWFVPIRNVIPRTVKSHHLHAATTRWFDGDAAAHTANVKPYSISPLVDSPIGAEGGVGIEVGTLTDTARERLLAATSEGSRIRLGSRSYELGRSHLLQHDAWPDLAFRAQGSQWSLNFVTPTTFRSGDRSSPLPTAQTILGGLASIWSQSWSPLMPPAITEMSQSVWISDIDLRSVVITIPLQGHDGNLQHLTASGSLGTITLRCDRPPLCPQVGALLATSAYSGIGSMTARGLGVTRFTAGRAVDQR